MALWDDIATNLPTVILALVVVAIAVVLERLITLYVRRLSSLKGWSPPVTVGLTWAIRLPILLSTVATLMRVGGIPPDWFVAISAVGGAAVGFASTRTLGNLIAGLFVLVTRPFQVNDYVRIDGAEGIVEEITFNYTKLRTRGGTLVYISNVRILDQNIVNYRYQNGESKLYCYPVQLEFDHALSTEQLTRVFDGVIEHYTETLPRKPEYAALTLGAFARNYVFYLYVKDPKEVFGLHFKFVDEIMRAWEGARRKG